MKTEDGRVLPVITGAVVDADGNPQTILFQIDTGADRTVLSYAAVALIGADLGPSDGYRLEGVGGVVPAGTLTTAIYFLSAAGDVIPFKGTFAALTDPAEDGISLLGRDVLRLLVLIMDQPGDTICLLHGRHRYVIQES